MFNEFDPMAATTTSGCSGARARSGPAVPAVKLAITRFGDFGDALSVSAMVDGIAPGRNGCNVLAVSYRGRVQAWVDFPLGADRAAVVAAVINRADWLLGSRCPNMDTYPLEIS
jgi:hypothetical protein